MKKLKSSVKAIIISAVVLVAALGVVLGVVFGMKGNDGNGGKPSKPQLLTNEQISLFNAVNVANKNNNADDLANEINVESFVLDDGTTEIPLGTISQYYETYIVSKVSGEEKYYIKTTNETGDCCYVELFELRNLEETPIYSRVRRVVNTYAYIVYSYEYEVNYEILDFSNPKNLRIVKSFEVETQKQNPTEADVARVSIDISDELFYVFYSEGETLNEIMANYSWSVYSYDGVYKKEYTNFSTDGRTNSPFKVDDKAYYFVQNLSNCYFGFLTDEGVKSFHLELDPAKTYNYTLTNEFLFIEEVTGNLGSQSYKYYVTSKDMTEIKEYSLGEGYYKATIKAVDDKYFYVFEQKKAEDMVTLENNGVMKYFDSLGNQVFMYDAKTVNDTLVYSKGTKLLLAETGIIETTKTNVNTVKFKYSDLKEKLNLIDDDKAIYQLTDKKVVNNLFVVEAQGLKYILDFDANIVFDTFGYLVVKPYENNFFASNDDVYYILNTTSKLPEILDNYSDENKLISVGSGYYFVDVLDSQNKIVSYEMYDNNRKFVDNVKEYELLDFTFNTNTVLKVVLLNSNESKFYDTKKTISSTSPYAGNNYSANVPYGITTYGADYSGTKVDGTYTISYGEYYYVSSIDNLEYEWWDNPFIGNATHYYASFDLEYDYSNDTLTFSDKKNMTNVYKSSSATVYSSGIIYYVVADWNESVCPDIDGHEANGWTMLYYTNTYGKFRSYYYSTSDVYSPTTALTSAYTYTTNYPDQDSNLTFGPTTNCIGATFQAYSSVYTSTSAVSSVTVGTAASSLTKTYYPQTYTYATKTYIPALLTGVTPNSRYVFAIYSPITYSISYDYDGGSAGTTAPTSATFGTAFSISKPSKTGYTFAGWSISGMTTNHYKYYGTSSSMDYSIAKSTTSKTLGASYNYFQNLRSSSGTVTFKATWTPIVYNILYNYDGGSAGTKAPSTGTYDSWVNITPAIKTGYTFTYWYIGDTYTDGTKYYMSSGIEKYFGLTSATADYTVESSTIGAYGGGKIYQYFKNLRSDSGGYVCLKAYWSANTYTISYSMGDDTGTTTATKGSSSPTSATYDSWFQVSNPTRTGYQFAGWTITSMGTTDSTYTTAVTHYYGTSTASYLTTTDASVSGVKGTYFKNLESFAGYSVTFTAVWTPNVYNLNYTLGGGTNATGTPTTAKFDEWFYIAYPTRVGYTFASWNLSDMNYTTGVYHYFGNSTTDYTTNQSTALNGVTATYFMNLDYGSGWTAYFTAVWTANKYYIEYVAGGGELGDKKPSEATFDQWFSISVPASAPQGYYFNGWVISNMTTDCDHYYGSSTTVYTTNKLATHTAETTDLYFKNLHSGSLSTTYTITITINWSPYEYDVSYDLRGGTHGSTHPSSAYYDTPFSVSNPTRSGYTFDGWSFNGLNDICTHYYYNSSNVSTSFTSTNGRYPDAINPNYDTIVYVSKFMNLDINGSAVLLVANWTANTYTITYYYIPTTFDTSSVTIETLNNAGYMTASKTQTVTFDMNFTTYKPSNSGVNSNEFALPNGVRAEYWVVSTSKLSNSTSVVSWSDDTSSSITGAAYAFDTDYIYDTYAQDIYCYVAYIYSDITVKYYIASSADTRNNLAGYSYYLTDAAKYNMLYTTKSLSGIAGWLISANHFVSGSMSPGSYSVFTFKGTIYSATNGGKIWWIYSNTNAYNFDDPVYYAYAVYTVNGTYSLEPPIEEEVDVAEEKEPFAMNEVSIDNVETYDAPEEKVDEKIILTNSSIAAYVLKEEYIDPKNIKK